MNNAAAMVAFKSFIFRYPLGFVQVSDHARQQLEEGLPKRSCGNTAEAAARPLTESWALRAGTKVL
jgi:hypothetical protein